MGYTSFTIEKIEGLIAKYNPKYVIDFGAQNNYAQPKIPAPYISEWYAHKGIDYLSIDINGENDSWIIDFAYPIWPQLEEKYKITSLQVDILVDAGTMEHVGINGKFDWEAIYNCFKSKFELLKIGGILYSENPKQDNWPGHGFSYFSKQFYHQLCAFAQLEILELGEHPACGNDIDGWNVYAVLKKFGEEFPSLEKFMTFDIKQS